MIHSAEEFVRLRTSESRTDYLLAAEDEAPDSVWMDVLRRFPEMKEWVAHNKTVPLEVLRLLAEDAESGVRAVVAEKRKLSVELFDRLSRDPDEFVRQRIAYNKKTPLEILRRLAIDKSELVRLVAQKRLFINP